MAEFTVGDKLSTTLARVRGLANGPIGTGPLLWSVAHDKEVAALLDAFDVTPRVVLAVLKTPGRVAAEPGTGPLWNEDATPNPGPFDGYEHVRDNVDHVLPLSAAAAVALRANARDSRVQLLEDLLADPGAEASVVLRDCGVDPEEVRRAAREGVAPQRPDRLPPALRPARDALLGRVRYRGRGLRDKLLLSVLAREANHADQPVLWVRLEADERAREQRRDTRTDDLLLALLVTHEVLAAYPHLAAASPDKFGGGAALLAEGIDHDRVRAAPVDGKDEIAPATILRPGPDWPDDTRELLDRLLTPGTRSARVIQALRAG